ncbi:hypothetical protein ABEB36_000442 [Hypothenemus hampei]|uniref:Cap-specific mRNA (nucleoside-2'-O-)-methyltransferase 1 n=1 Tax=Hypothenemus hampei TaxID=57062 RepID=A0ABD1FBA5_HYPHA
MQENENQSPDNSKAPAAGPSGLAMNNKALRMMKLMGYKPGSGLGKKEQGPTTSIDVQSNLGRRGLGLQIVRDSHEEDIIIEEKVNWLLNENTMNLDEVQFDEWLIEGPPVQDVLTTASFCDAEILKNVFNAKNIYEELDVEELNRARTRANCFETIKYVFFMNRAALKMANIDAACDFMFTNVEDEDLHHPPIYFADVCAGPGGFTEYILWRKSYKYKGFGLTLKDEHDFKISESTCASVASFQALYGANEDGDVRNPDNIEDFCDRVKHETTLGVHFLMSDGGFAVDGQENLQEVLSKHIYLCQCLLALKVLRPNGHFVTKTFDVFTPFSVGLLYLMYLCFDQVGILKPNSSRPANSERYFICKNFKQSLRTKLIRDYLSKISIRMWELRTLPDRDILELVPRNVIEKDTSFYNYLLETNNSIARRQTIALEKLAKFCRNPSLIDERQEYLRKACLDYWKIPDFRRKSGDSYNVENLFKDHSLSIGDIYGQPKYINKSKSVMKIIENLTSWHYAYMESSELVKKSNFYAGVRYSRTYRFQSNKWAEMKHLHLAKGTLLYGELVKETFQIDNKVEKRYSLHVIDAFALGHLNLTGYRFEDRLANIKLYCEAINKESQTKYSIRIRPKDIWQLNNALSEEVLFKNVHQACARLSLLGYKAKQEWHAVNSIFIMNSSDPFCLRDCLMIPIQLADHLRRDVLLFKSSNAS